MSQIDIWKKYKKINIIGNGIYGNIYKVKNKINGYYYAIQEIDKQKINQTIDILKREIEIMNKIKKENIVNIKEVIDSNKFIYVVMDLCECNLEEYIKRREKQISINEIKNVLIQINNILKLIPKEKKVHKNLNPNNILISLDSLDKTLIKLCCFSNIINNTMNRISLTISPEILNNDKDLSKSDLWSIGIIIYFMYFKEYPYIGKNELMLFKDINSGKKLKSIENKELNDLLNKLLKINIKERLSWNEYFNHSFFENGKDEIIKEKLNFISKDERKNELYDILFSSVPKEYLKKNTTSYIFEEINPILPLIGGYENLNSKNSSNIIFLSNDIIILLTKNIYDIKLKKYTQFIGISDKQLELGNDNEINFDNFIIENDENKNIISIIKLINEEFIFNDYFEINSNLEILSEEKFIIENKKEISIGIKISNNNKITNYNPGTPIIIKKNNKKYLIGIINIENYYHIFNKKELIDIENKLNIINNNFYQIEKLDFMNKNINDKEMNFIFQYNFNNLIFLNLENNKISNKGLIYLQNKSLRKLEYLNLSNNKINDEGLKYLNELSNLNELIILNMNLSDNYFLILEENSFINKIYIIECDKSKLIIKKITENFKGFKLPNLTYLKFERCGYIIDNYLKILFSCNNICSVLKYLDLSNTDLSDNGMLRLKNNLSKIKNIQTINLENTLLTLNSKKYFEYFQDLKIQILIDQTKLIIPNKTKYKIILGGSTISGKTSYFCYCSGKTISENVGSFIQPEYTILSPSFNNNIKVRLWDTCHWNWDFDRDNIYLKNADGVLLLFDITSRDDFEGLNNYLKLITKDFKLEDFPVLLIANKIDLKREIEKEEIEKFQKDNKLIGNFEVSCKEGINVIESFDFLVDYLIKKEIKNNK